MRYLPVFSCGYPFNMPLQDPQPFYSFRLFTVLKHELKAQTYSEKRSILPGSLLKDRHKPVALKPLHRVSEGSNTRQDDFISIQDLLRIPCEYPLFTEIFHCFFYAFYVPRIIIDYCNHIPSSNSASS